MSPGFGAGFLGPGGFFAGSSWVLLGSFLGPSWVLLGFFLGCRWKRFWGLRGVTAVGGGYAFGGAWNKAPAGAAGFAGGRGGRLSRGVFRRARTNIFFLAGLERGREEALEAGAEEEEENSVGAGSGLLSGRWHLVLL